MKRNEKVNEKWPPKRGKPQDASEKENVAPYKKINAVEKGHGSQPREQHTRGDSKGLMQCWICGKDHHKKDSPLY